MASAIRNTQGSSTLRNSFLINPAGATVAIYIFSGSADQAGTERLKNVAHTILLEDAQDQMWLLGKIILRGWAEQCGTTTGVIE